MDTQTLQRAKRCEWNIATINMDLKKLDEMLTSEKSYIQYDLNATSVRFIELDADARNKVYELLKNHLKDKKRKNEKELEML